MVRELSSEIQHVFHYAPIAPFMFESPLHSQRLFKIYALIQSSLDARWKFFAINYTEPAGKLPILEIREFYEVRNV
jgi:hypothetical protein